MDNASGTIFLDKGSCGTVYRNTRGNAIKVIPHTSGTVLFPMELSLMLTYRHPHLNSAIEVKLYNDRIEIEQEEAKWNLSDYLRARKPSKYLARKWMFSLFSATAVLHRDNIIHCDIKPKNILITRDRELKLTDFGFAMMLTRRIIPREPLGTLAYMAPEVLLTGILRKEADVWSCLCVCYEILALKRLVPGQSSTQTDKVRQKLSIRYKTIKSIQTWRQSLGDHVEPELGSLSHSPVLDILPDNELGRLVKSGMRWELCKRPTIQELLEDGAFTKLDPIPGKIKCSKLLVTTSEYEHFVLGYLKSRTLSKLDRELRTALVSLYSRVKTTKISNYTNLVLVEACLLIIFRLFHYNFDSFYLVSSASEVDIASFDVYRALHFRVHSPHG